MLDENSTSDDAASGYEPSSAQMTTKAFDAGTIFKRKEWHNLGIQILTESSTGIEITAQITLDEDTDRRKVLTKTFATVDTSNSSQLAPPNVSGTLGNELWNAAETLGSFVLSAGGSSLPIVQDWILSLFGSQGRRSQTLQLRLLSDDDDDWKIQGLMIRFRQLDGMFNVGDV